MLVSGCPLGGVVASGDCARGGCAQVSLRSASDPQISPRASL